jgi:hypothetical protein
LYEGRDNVVKAAKITNVRSKRANGGKSEPVTTMVEYIPRFGSGKPSPEVIARPDGRTPNPKLGGKNLTAQGIGCTANGVARVKVAVRRGPGETSFDLANTHVRVYDENPWLPSALLADSYTDNYGNLWFYKPDCDFGAWWDYSQPDIYFEIESVELPGNISVGTFGPFWYTHTVRTATNWDTSSTLFVLDLNASNSAAEQGVWNLKRAQHAKQTNTNTGGPGATPFQMRVVWPGICGVCPGQTASLISRLELAGNAWYAAYPFFHEFGHELSYFLTNQASYNNYANMPWQTIVIPGFDFNHVCHGYTNGCGDDHGYADGFAHFFYNKYGNAFSGMGGGGVFTATTNCPGFGSKNPKGEEEQVASVFEELERQYGSGAPYNNAFANFKSHYATMGYATGILSAWNIHYKNSLSPAKQAAVKTYAAARCINLP